MKTITKSNKQVNIIERRVLHRLGLVVYRCKSSRGESVYNTTLKNGKAQHCTCDGHAEWHRTCYHMEGCEAAEAQYQQERRETRNAYYELSFIA